MLVMTTACGAGTTCEDWISGPLHAQSQNLEGYVACAAVWQPPTGPPLLVIGGEFTTVGGVLCNNLAAWDGASWRAIGGGTNGRVNALASYNGELIVGGEFAITGNQQTNFIARWTGTEWLGLYGSQGGPGIFADDFPTLTRCNGLAVYQGYLFVVGHFTHAGGAPARNIAFWYHDPPTEYSEWAPVGDGIYNADNSFATGTALAEHNAILYIGGSFNRAGGMVANNIASWHGGGYGALGSGLSGGSGYATSLLSAGGDLIVGGVFTHAGGIAVNYVARWNGAWSAIGAGLPNNVWALRTNNGLLYAATDASGLVRVWNEFSWVTVGTGLAGGASMFCGALTVYNGQLIAGGEFTNAGGSAADSIAQYNGLSWSALQSPHPQVLCMEQFGNRLIAGGAFVQSATNEPPAQNLIGWDGANLSRLSDSSGVGEAGPNGTVHAMKFTSLPGFQTLIIGGEFTQVASATSPRIASYTISNFNPPTWAGMGSGFNDAVFAIERFSGATYAGGQFTASGATSVSRIARWTGTTWAALGTGMNGTVRALKTFNGFLYAGGEFTTAGGVSTGGLARWNGSAWSNVGGFFNGIVYALEVHNGELIIGGFYPGLPGAPNIAKYNGTVYSNLGSGGTNGAVTELRSTGTHVYVAGGFTVAGGTAAQGLARWNASEGWSGVGGGIAEPVNALAFFHNELNVGLGILIGLNEPETAPPGKGWLRYTFAGAPWVVQHPVSQSMECLEHAVFSVQVADGFGSASYQWRRNGIPLNDGPTGHNNSILGAHTSTMTIYAVRAVDAADYDCIVFNSCGSEISQTAVLTTTCCAGDINFDGVVNVIDMLTVINGWGVCVTPPTLTSCTADIAPFGGGDNAVNVADMLQVINGWGVCP